MSIIVIDDEVLIGELVGEVLRQDGYDVIIANTPDEVRKFADAAPDLELAIIDAVMPLISGPELADHLVENHPQLKIMFMSGLGRFAISLAFVQAFEWIGKPFTTTDLKNKVREIMGNGGGD